MGAIFGKKQKTKSAEEIRKEEKAAMSAESLKNINAQEEKRQLLRANQGPEEEDEINRKKLLGA